MKRRLILNFFSASFAVTLLLQAACAPEAVQPHAPAKDSAFDYDGTIAGLKAGKTEIDFRELRMEYAKRPEYEPYPKNEKVRQAWKAYAEERYSEALKLAEEALGENYLNIDAHMICDLSCTKLNRKGESELHHKIAVGLLRSICSKNDGFTVESACVVISVEEEYALLRIKGLKMDSQSLVKENGHSYDKLGVSDPSSGRQFEIYFNIDRPWAALQNRLEAGK